MVIVHQLVSVDSYSIAIRIQGRPGILIGGKITKHYSKKRSTVIQCSSSEVIVRIYFLCFLHDSLSQAQY